MAEKFPIGFWNYNGIEDFEPEEVSVWADCGITVTMAPRFIYGMDDPDRLHSMLDAAEKRGVKLILWIMGMEAEYLDELGEEKYRERVAEIVNRFAHPALYGFFVGDEPSSAKAFEFCWNAVKIQRETAPNLRPYLNLHTGMDYTPTEQLGGRMFREWLKDFAADTGFRTFSYGHYDQLWDENGIDSYYRNLKTLIEAAKDAGVDVWNTMLSSAHYMFRIPTEYELMWQITTAAACGSRGIMWFRFYDRPHGPNYHGSPVDEYGNRTETYYNMLRANRRFQDHFGELIMKLHHKASYLTGKTYGGLEIFEHNKHPIIEYVRSTEQALISFFSDDDNQEYLVLVNASMKNPGVYRPEFDREKYKLEKYTFNGTQVSEYFEGKSEEHWDGEWLYPGQMCIYRIANR